MSTSVKASGDNNFSDFDDDDDLADLLDDDDDIYAKKLSKTSPSKNIPVDKNVLSKAADGPIRDTQFGRKSSSVPLSSPERKKSISSVFSPEKKKSIDFSSILESSPKHVGSKRNSEEFEGNDALSEFLNKTSLPKTKPKSSSPLKKSDGSGKTKYPDDLDFLKSSPKSKSLKHDADDSFPKDEFNSDDDDLLKSLDSDGDKSVPSSPLKKRGSFFNDLQKNFSPKHSAKKLKDSNEFDDLKNLTKGTENEEANGIGYKIENPIQDGKLTKKRESFFKQVSFKDSPEKLAPTIKPVEELPIKQISDSNISSASQRNARRSEKMAPSKESDMDWSTFFTETSNKTTKDNTKSLTKKDRSLDEVPTPDALSNRRKSSGAEWLGLNEPDTPSKPKSSGKKPSEKDSWLDSDFSNTSTKEVVTKSRRPRTAPSADTSWLEDFGPSLNQENKSPEVTQKHIEKSPKKDFVNISPGGVLEVLHNKKESNSSLPIVKEDTYDKVVLEKDISKTDTAYSSQMAETPYVHPQIVQNDLTNFQTAAALPVYNTTSDNRNIQAAINSHILERDQLIKSSEAMKAMYEERIKTMEALQKDQLKSLEESFNIIENNLKKDMENKIQVYETKLAVIEKEKDMSEKSLKEKFNELEKQHLKEIQKLKDLHNLSVMQMKQDHEEALNRLNRLKDQEVEAILSTQAHSKSLQNLADQLEARTAELANLQAKVEERNQATLRERQAVLDSKERDLKALQNRLQRQLEDGDEERNRLQQLVLRLESRLQKSATEGEEDRWDVQQLKARLNVKQKYLDEEYKLNMDQIEREKEKLQMNQNSLLQEQKMVLLQLAEERQQLTREKNDVEQLSKRVKEEEAKFNVKKLKEESYIERQKQFIQQEESRLQLEKNNLKSEIQQAEREKDMFERDKMQFINEKERFNEFSLKVKRRADEVEHLAMSTSEEKERARLEQQVANKIKNEQHSKLQQISQQMQTLMEKEHQILQEREKLAEEKFELENKRSSMVCVKCKVASQLPLNVQPPNLNATPLMSYPAMNGITTSMPQTFIEPNLILWQLSAQKDHAYLEQELAYLQSLKGSIKKFDLS